jgi:hypothetical protein
MKHITFCLMTCGEQTEKDCIRAIQSFRDRIDFFEVRNVYPQITALNYMIDGVWTEYFVALDADMILNPDAFSRICEAIEKHQSDDTWHTILFPLYDTLTDRRILSLKVMRSRIMKKFPFAESATPDVEHHSRLEKAGYRSITDYLDTDPIGKHVVVGHHFCYHKYRDVYLTYRSHGKVWDAGVFLGGNNLKELSKNHFDFFFYRWAMTGNWDYLSCIAGMVDGLTSNELHHSKSLKPNDYRVSIGKSPFDYIEWYEKQSVLLF